MKKTLIIVLISVFGGFLKAQDLDELNRSSSNSHEHFGWTMAITEEWLVIGSPHSETSAGLDAGKIVVYRKDGASWNEFQVIENQNGDTFQNFGFAIDMSTSVMVIGAIGTFQSGPFTGKAFVYEFDGTTWSLTAELESDAPAAGHYFGHAVATNGNRIAVSAIKANGLVESTGAVYVYEKSNDVWSLTNTLTADDGSTNDNFGYDIDMNVHGRIVVGAPNQTDFIDKSGAVYVFDTSESGYDQTAKLKVFDRTEKDYFGTSVSINRNDIVAGAYLADGSTNNSGAAYFFRLDGENWTMEQEIFSLEGELNDYFGRTVAMSDFRLVIGAPKTNVEDGNDVGSGYYYEKEGGLWVLKQSFEDPNGSDHNFFGAALAVSDFDLAIASKLYDGQSDDGGTVYTSGLGEVLSNDEIVLEESIRLGSFPNPTQSDITIRFRLSKPSSVGIQIFDQQGKPVNTLLPESIHAPGDKEFIWNLKTQGGALVRNGLYLYKLSIDGNVFTRKIIVSR